MAMCWLKGGGERRMHHLERDQKDLRKSKKMTTSP